jgi:hypothetical protein
MIGLILVSFLLCLATMLGVLALLFLVFRMQVRSFNAVVAADRLNDWEVRLAQLEPAEREVARATPPAAVLEAMLDLPSRGLAGFFAGGWGERPLQAKRRSPDAGTAPTTGTEK